MVATRPGPAVLPCLTQLAGQRVRDTRGAHQPKTIRMDSTTLAAYLDRIAWGGGTAPTFGTLSGLVRAHMQAIPFENLDVLLGRPVSLDIDAIAAKLVHARRGGYCFEHATLFAHVLEELGFGVARHSARVTLVVKRHEAKRLHMFLTVALPDGVFVVDPGFGGPAALRPLPLADAGAEPPHGATPLDGERRRLLDVAHDRRRGGARRLGLDARARSARRFRGRQPLHCDASRLALPQPADAESLHARRPRQRDEPRRDHPERRDADLPAADRAALRAFIADHLGFDFPEVDALRAPFIPEWN